MYINFNLAPEKTQELENYVKEILPNIINEKIFSDENKLKQMVKECVRANIKATINDLMQGKEFREYLRDMICKQIGIE